MVVIGIRRRSIWNGHKMCWEMETNMLLCSTQAVKGIAKVCKCIQEEPCWSAEDSWHAVCSSNVCCSQSHFSAPFPASWQQVCSNSTLFLTSDQIFHLSAEICCFLQAKHVHVYPLACRLSCFPSVKQLGFKVAWSWCCVRHVNMPVCMTQQCDDCAVRLLQALYILPLEGCHSCITPCKILPGASVPVLRLQHCEQSQGWWSVKHMDTGLLCVHCYHFDTSLASGAEVKTYATLCNKFKQCW